MLKLCIPAEGIVRLNLLWPKVLALDVIHFVTVELIRYPDTEERAK